MPAPTPAAATSARAVVNLFVYNGLVIGVYAASLAALRERLGLDAAGIAILLVCAGLAAITGMQLGGRMSDRIGARRIVLVCLPLLLVGLAVFGFATSYPMLIVGRPAARSRQRRHRRGDECDRRPGRGHPPEADHELLPRHVVDRQLHRRRPGAARRAELAVRAGPGRRVVVTALGVLSIAASLRITPETAVVDHTDHSGARTAIPRWAYLLGLMAIAFGLGEGTAMDWSGLHVTEVAGIPAAQGSVAVTVVAGFMVAIRLLGDALVARFGRRAVVRFGGACAALGYLITALATPLPALLIGWAMVGFGVGMIAPQVYAVAGHAAGGRGLAVVVTFGYATFLCGPAVIGFLASQFGLHKTMLVPAILLAALPFLASVMPEETPTSAEP